MSEFQRPPTAQEAVLIELRARILGGELPAGSALRQEDLAASLGVSRVPVREALRMLESEGHVVYAAHRGYRVAELSVADLEEIYALRAVIEDDLAARAMPAMTADDLAQIHAAYAVLADAESSAAWLRGTGGSARQTRLQRPGHRGRNLPGPGQRGRNLPGSGHPGRNLPGPGHRGRNLPGPGQRGRNLPGSGHPGRNPHGSSRPVPGPGQRGSPVRRPGWDRRREPRLPLGDPAPDAPSRPDPHHAVGCLRRVPRPLVRRPRQRGSRSTRPPRDPPRRRGRGHLAPGRRPRRSPQRSSHRPAHGPAPLTLSRSGSPHAGGSRPASRRLSRSCSILRVQRGESSTFGRVCEGWAGRVGKGEWPEGRRAATPRRRGAGAVA